MANPSDVRWFAFGRFRLDSRALVLFRGSRVVPLPVRAVETLVALVRRPGEVLLKAARPGSGDLPRTISMLRKALSSSLPLIETVSGRGYRFTGKVRSTASADERTARRSTDAPPSVDAVDVVIRWRSGCDRHVWSATPQAAATAIGTTFGRYRNQERGGVHYRETTAGEIAVCMPSLVESVTTVRRSAG
jgi:DNA-binding winged helix-turn-helix (wHTH) protein